MDASFILKKYQELQDSNEIIILLKPKEYSKFDIDLFNKTYKDAISYKIIYNEEQIIFIKKLKIFKRINYRELSRKADKSFTKHDTDNAIKLYEILLLEKKPGVHVYARLGILYLSKNDISKALVYLKIATAMSHNTTKNKYDFTYLINKITKKQETKDDNAKQFVKISIQEFTNNLNEYYGLTQVKEVSILMNYQGMSVEEACLGLNISEDAKNMIILIFARDCYARNDMALGDEYLRKVEKSQNKSEQVKKLLIELRTNRLFYQNRVDENYKPLLRTRTLY